MLRTRNSSALASASRPAQILFLGSAYAGHQTRFLNLKAHTSGDSRIQAKYRSVSGWERGGLIERVPLLPNAAKGRMRAVLQSSAMAAWPRPDAIWTSVKEVAIPFLWSQVGPLERPMILDMDCTVAQLEELAPIYYGRAPKRGTSLAWALFLERLLWSKTALFTPWSEWAARDLRRRGIPENRIKVLPPGVDLNLWQPGPRLASAPSGRLRLLFVGGDFLRKGGDMLLDVFSTQFESTCHLDIVTRDDVEPRPHVEIHRAETNSPLLRELYARADLFVLPTRAECFGIAAVEALASGLPVVISKVGGTEDVVREGKDGWLIEPNASSLARALREAVAQPDRLKRMGEQGRLNAEKKFDGTKNDQVVLELLLEMAWSRGAARGISNSTAS